MKYLLLVLLLLVASYFLYLGFRLYTTVQVSKELIESAVAYELKSENASNAVLVLGDSTAVGVGSSSAEETVAGKVSEYISATSVENYGKSGAVTTELMSQIPKAQLDSYKLILVQIGGNDIVRFRSAKETAEELRTALTALPNADKVIVISAGNVGGATLIPWFLRPIYTNLNKEYHTEFARVAAEEGVIYVNLYADPSSQLIEEQPEIYLASDGFHPSSAGYRLWFEAIKPFLR